MYKLVLHPHSDCIVESWNKIKSALADVGFMGGSYGNESEQRFFIGERFLQLITFMGCSPHLKLEPENEQDYDFCHVQLSPIYSSIQFRSRDSEVFARCPGCGRRIAAWQQVINTWQVDADNAQFNCPACLASASPLQLGWRHSAGFARLFIDVYSVYPHEGIPNEQLLSALQNSCGCDWAYFYTNSQEP